MRILYSLLFITVFLRANGQEPVAAKAHLTVTGYLKDMQWVSFSRTAPDSYFSNLFHNRINFQLRSPGPWTARLEIRNRFYWGDEYAESPILTQAAWDLNGLVDLGVVWSKGQHHWFQSEIDRMLVEYRKRNWVITAGRQRINWGVNMTWNPNDIFNAYQFLNFDYEERPGSDGLTVRYLLSPLSHVELAASGSAEGSIAAMKYLTHFSGYDIQFIGGYYHGKMTLGSGWAGSIGKLGFKGELEFFANRGDSANQLNLSLELSQMLKSNWFVSLAGLYNRNGINREIPVTSFSFPGFSSEWLMPFRWNLLLNSIIEINPAWNVNISFVYSPGSQVLVFFPGIQHNLNDNLDLDFFWQSYLDMNQKPEAGANAAYLRIRRSF